MIRHTLTCGSRFVLAHLWSFVSGWDRPGGGGGAVPTVKVVRGNLSTD